MINIQCFSTRAKTFNVKNIIVINLSKLEQHENIIKYCVEFGNELISTTHPRTSAEGTETCEVLGVGKAANGLEEWFQQWHYRR